MRPRNALPIASWLRGLRGTRTEAAHAVYDSQGRWYMTLLLSGVLARAAAGKTCSSCTNARTPSATHPA